MSSTEQETMQGIEKLVSDDVYEAAQTSSNGLEASQVQKRQELYGLNRLNEVKGQSNCWQKSFWDKSDNHSQRKDKGLG